MPDEKETRQKIQFKKHLIDVGIKATLGHTISVQLDNLEKKMAMHKIFGKISN